MLLLWLPGGLLWLAVLLTRGGRQGQGITSTLGTGPGFGLTPGPGRSCLTVLSSLQAAQAELGIPHQTASGASHGGSPGVTGVCSWAPLWSQLRSMQAVHGRGAAREPHGSSGWWELRGHRPCAPHCCAVSGLRAPVTPAATRTPAAVVPVLNTTPHNGGHHSTWWPQWRTPVLTPVRTRISHLPGTLGREKQ